MSPDNDQTFAELSAAAATFTKLLPHPAGVGGLLMLYDNALIHQFTAQQMQDCFGDDQLEAIGYAYAAAAEYWVCRHGAEPASLSTPWDELESELAAAAPVCLGLHPELGAEDLP